MGRWFAVETPKGKNALPVSLVNCTSICSSLIVFIEVVVCSGFKTDCILGTGNSMFSSFSLIIYVTFIYDLCFRSTVFLVVSENNVIHCPLCEMTPFCIADVPHCCNFSLRLLSLESPPEVS